MPRRKWRGVPAVGPAPHGYIYHVQATKIVTHRVIRQKFYEDPPWREQMRLLANPWHVKRRYQVELGFKLLAVARGEPLDAIVTEA